MGILVVFPELETLQKFLSTNAHGALSSESWVARIDQEFTVSLQWASEDTSEVLWYNMVRAWEPSQSCSFLNLVFSLVTVDKSSAPS